MAFSISFGNVKPLIIKKNCDLIEFHDSYQANRFYSILKSHLKGKSMSMVDVDRLLMETYGNKYDSGEFKPTWRDWGHTIKADDIILRSYSEDYATLYFKGVEQAARKPVTMKDFKAELKDKITLAVSTFVRDNPDFDATLIDDVMYMIQVKDLKATKILVVKEVEE